MPITRNPIPAAAVNFFDLTDTPVAYGGLRGTYFVVNSTEDGLVATQDPNVAIIAELTTPVSFPMVRGPKPAVRLNFPSTLDKTGLWDATSPDPNGLIPGVWRFTVNYQIELVRDLSESRVPRLRIESNLSRPGGLANSAQVASLIDEDLGPMPDPTTLLRFSKETTFTTSTGVFLDMVVRFNDPSTQSPPLGSGLPTSVTLQECFVVATLIERL